VEQGPGEAGQAEQGYKGASQNIYPHLIKGASSTPEKAPYFNTGAGFTKTIFSAASE